MSLPLSLPYIWHYPMVNPLSFPATELVSTSARKLAFDQAQLAYVLAEPSVQLSAEAKPYLAAVRDSYRDIAKFLAEYSLDGQFVRVSCHM